MMFEMEKPIIPTHIKAGVFGDAKSGKTNTMARMLAQFIKEYCPESQLAMFDTEPSAGYIAKMVREISGKDLMVKTSRSFTDMLEFTHYCIEHKLVAMYDSITHPWRALCKDYLTAKRSRVRGANGNPETTIIGLKDWGNLKEIWAEFSELFAYAPYHAIIIGREGDVWDDVVDEEGKAEMRKTGVKMKTESDLGYEPSLLMRMTFTRPPKDIKDKSESGHFIYCIGDRFDELTGKWSDNNPDIEYFRPYLNRLDLGGKAVVKSEGQKVFGNTVGASYETLKAQRDAILENIKDDIQLSFPGQTAGEKKAKIEAARAAFGTSGWSELESNWKLWPVEKLAEGRAKLQEHLKTVTITAKE